MKKHLLLFISFLLLAGYLTAQNDSPKPVVMRAVYFDVSPPLRDMVKKAVTPADETWKNKVVKNFYDPRRNNPDIEKMVPFDPGRQTYNGSRGADTVLQSFDGVPNPQGYCPPDTDGDVGPDHYFQVVNCSFAIYSKTGTKLLGPNLNSTVWQGMSNNSNDGDAIVLYDEVADRWLFSQFSLPNYPNGPFYEMVAISQTPDPTGSWYRFQFQFSDMPDYPKLGVWPDGYYMTCNRFSSGSTSFQGTGAAAFNRTKMIAGDATAEMVYFTLPSGNDAYGVLPSDCDGTFPDAGTPNYFTYFNNNPDRMDLRAFHVDWTTPANSTYELEAQLPVDAFVPFPWSTGLPQKGTSTKIAILGDRLMFRAQVRKFSDHLSMVTCHSINVGSTVSGVRWYELRKTGSNPWEVYQSGTYNPDNDSRFMGSIAMDTDGNMCLAYSITSSTRYPSIYYTGRMNGDPLGQMTISEGVVVEGTGSQTNTWSGNPSRWGDYSSMNCDPSTPATFWYTQEYYKTVSDNSWKTRIGCISFGGVLSLVLSATPDTLCQGSGASTQLNAEPAGGSGSYTFSWTSNPPGFASTVQNPTATPDVDTYYICTINDGSQSKTDSILVHVLGPPHVFAGNDTSYCWYVPAFPLNGVVDNYNHVKWTTSGDGHFNIDTVVNTLYFTGQADRDLGSVTLTLTAEVEGICPASGSDAIVVILDPCTGIPQPSAENLGILIQPNPARDLFTLTIGGVKNSPATITITDMQGRTVLSDNVNGNGATVTRTIDVSKYRKGAYLVKVQTDKEISTERLIIQ
jgi:hypothetical protein